jgi:magnesium chelatase family protein
MQRYRNKISGPLLDRIDIHVEVPAMEYQQLASLEKGENSAAIRERVVASRAVQRARFAKHKGVHAVHCNAIMRAKDVHKYCVLEDDAQGLLKAAMANLHLSARAYDRILKVARTIADLAGTEHIAADHVAEAVQYRSLDRSYWA